MVYILWDLVSLPMFRSVGRGEAANEGEERVSLDVERAPNVDRILWLVSLFLEVIARKEVEGSTGSMKYGV